MQYRKLPHGEEQIYPLGIGLGCIQQTPPDEIERIIKKAVDNGINFFDLCGGGSSVYAPFGRAVKGNRERIYVQMHFGAVYNSAGEYAWSRDLEQIKRTVEWELKTMEFDYMDFGFLHCVDTDEDFETLMSNGVFDYIKQLKKQGTVRHIGCSSHTPSVANRLLDTGLMDMMLFSINAAYDFEKGDEYGIGSASERFALFNRCQAEGVGISVMKPYFGGKLLSDQESPFGKALTQAQCLQYCLDRPGVLAVVPGITTMEELVAYMKEHNIPNVKALYTHSIKVLTDMVLDMGKIPVVWEGFPKEGSEGISRKVVVTAWESLYHLPNELIEEGFTVTNSSWMPLYVVKPDHPNVKNGRWYPKDILSDWNIYTWKNWWEKRILLQARESL